MDPVPTARGFAHRADILAIGSLYAEDTPNFDGLRWFLDQVWPIVSEALPGVRLLVAGFVAEGLDAATLLAGPGVVHLGFAEDLPALYDQARVFIAPTRFSAGIPYKVHEAAAHGVPVVATGLLADQLGWQDGQDLLACDASDPASFAEAVIDAYRDPLLWHALRNAALERITRECGREGFAETVGALLG
jgi:glycosyltransferase involved in cell wall biosynthesis